MLATYKAKVVGMKGSKGEFDEPGGREVTYDNCKVYIELKLTGDRARGVATESYKIGSSDLYEKFISIPLPFFAEIDVEKVSTGNEERELVTGFRPLEGFKENTFDGKPAAVAAVK